MPDPLLPRRDASLTPLGPRPRLVAALVVATVAGLWSTTSYFNPALHTDLWQVLFGAESMLRGRDPYQLVGGREFPWPWPLLYPATAFAAVSPLTVFARPVAVFLFVAAGAGLLGWGVLKEGWFRIWIFLSFPFIDACVLAQWSPLFLAGLFVPSLAFFYAAKPTLGAAMLLASGSLRAARNALIGGAVLGGMSLLFLPHWPASWLHAIAGAPHIRAPVALMGGPLILLALLRWRRPEARLILAMAIVPHTTFWYEALPLLLVARSWRESQGMALLLSAGGLAQPSLIDWRNNPNFFTEVGTMIVAVGYLPAVLLVLRRPNDGPVPEIVQRVLRRARRLPFVRALSA